MSGQEKSIDGSPKKKSLIEKIKLEMAILPFIFLIGLGVVAFIEGTDVALALGKLLAVGGLITWACISRTGFVVSVLVLIGYTIFTPIPGLLQSKVASNENNAIGTLREVYAAQQQYRALTSKKFLFAIDLSYQDSLNKKQFSPSLKDKFKEEGLTISKLRFKSVSTDYKWILTDGMQMWAIYKGREKLDVSSYNPHYATLSKLIQQRILDRNFKENLRKQGYVFKMKISKHPPGFVAWAVPLLPKSRYKPSFLRSLVEDLNLLDPLYTGARGFRTDSSGVINYTSDGRRPTSQDPTLDY